MGQRGPSSTKLGPSCMKPPGRLKTDGPPQHEGREIPLPALMLVFLSLVANAQLAVSAAFSIRSATAFGLET